MTNRVLNNGSGVAAGDFDQDGNVDLFFCSLNQRNRLFKNLGHWQFRDVTAEAGLQFPPGYYRAAVFADLNGDGALDLLVGGSPFGVRCYLNNGRGSFKDATIEANTAHPFSTSTLALADVDGNGTLDLYSCNNRAEDIRDRPNVPVVFVNKKPTIPPDMRHRLAIENGVLQESGEPDILYLGDGHAHFRSVSWTNGAYFDARGDVLTNTPFDWGLCATFRDLNNDGAPDLYVCNDYWTPDRLWINGGRGRFKEADSLSLRKIPVSSMGADFADINRDGYPDLFAVDMLSRSSELRRRQTVAKRAIAPRPGDIESRIQAPQNALLLARGDGTYSEIAWMAGLAASDWSWSPVFLDVDLDGFDDVLVSAGHVRDIQDLDANDQIRARQGEWRRSSLAATNIMRAFLEARQEHSRLYPPLNMPIVSFRNRGDLRFEETTSSWGLNVPGVNHGLVVADLDNDGDLDVIVNRLGSPAGLFRNNSPAPRIAVRLRGRPPNTQAIGAKIELLGGAVSNQVCEVACGGGYMSGSDTLRVLAPGSAGKSMSLRISWRDGATTIVQDVKANHLYEIDEAVVARTPKTPAAPETRKAMFEDLSTWLDHRHTDEPFDDIGRQGTLPRKLDQGGPGLAWFDLDADGWEDLIIGAAKGGTMGVYRNENGKSFRRETNVLFRAALPGDQTTILGSYDSEGHPVILAGRASYEATAPGEMASAIGYETVRGKTTDLLPPHSASIGPLALGDVDGDGDLDLFAGGQVIPSHYPVPASSRLFRNVNGKWVPDEENAGLLDKVGIVNGGVWSDLNADGFPELLLACEWGPVRVFRNRGGRLTEATAEVGLERFT
ncbi:MAG TPA: CRTAC1 family protein, partial [Verrucomicrobiae bacterium]|nr:CRTAC1 family protein [Verrucomicrobiae bacterium]